jgi:Na+-driven multidrug efflux pump
LLIGVARGCGWQKFGAFVNLRSFYLAGIPLCVVLAFVVHMKSNSRIYLFRWVCQLRAPKTFCGQSYGAHQYHIVGIYTQRALLVSTLVSVPLSIIWAYIEPILGILHQDKIIAPQFQLFALYSIPS